MGDKEVQATEISGGYPGTVALVVESTVQQKLQMQSLSASKKEISKKLVDKARSISRATKRAVMTSNRKGPVTSNEDEALSPRTTIDAGPIVKNTTADNLRVPSSSASKQQTSYPKKSVKTARSTSTTSERLVRTRKRKEPTRSVEDETLTPRNDDQMENNSNSPVTEISPIAKKVRRGRAATSEVWEHFHEPNDEGDADPIARCMHCEKEYICRSVHGTSTLWKHLRYYCPMAPLKDEDKPRKEQGTPKHGYSYDDCRRSLVEMIITDEMPFKVVEGEGFIKYSRTLQPRFEVPSRTTVARDAMQIFHEEKAKLKMVLKNQRICLTTDTWTSNQNMNYMCLTAHWIDDGWQLQRRIINFCLVPDHRGETIGRKIEECLLQWDADRIFTITVDNASCNDGAISYMKELSKDWEGTVLRHEFIHMRCYAHIVNLIVKSGLEVTNDSINKIRIAVKFVRSSPARLDQFKKCAEKEKIAKKSLLSLDIETRWNATYIMLESALEFEKAFTRLHKENKQFRSYFPNNLPPGETDWQNATRIIHFLKLFYNVTLRLSGSLHVTSSGFFHEFVLMRSKLELLARNSDPCISEMAEHMKVKFSKYWEDKKDLNTLLFIAIILDPRCKLKYLSFSFSSIYDSEKAKEITDRIESDVHRLFDCYVKCVTSGNCHSNYRQPPVFIDVDEHEEDPSMLLASQFSMHLEEIKTRESNSELSRYLAENCEKMSDKFDILGWWKYNSNKYPILSTMAKDVLAVPVSTVASESAFSTGGRVIDSFRTSLSANMVEALICTQSWLRSPSDIVDIRKAVEELQAYEEIEQEFLARDMPES